MGFVKKYQKTANDLIGHFGLGFYSAFMVAKQVEIDTLSYKEGSEAIHWSCDGSPEFELTESSRTQIGTTVTLNLTDEDYLEFYRYLYPFQEDPLLWVHLNTDYPYLLNGILYFPKLRPDVDVSQGHIKLFCNQVFVNDHCEEIIP